MVEIVELEPSAYHEAGHAIVCTEVLIDLTGITIEPDPIAHCLGHVTHEEWKLKVPGDDVVDPSGWGLVACDIPPNMDRPASIL